MTVGNHDHHTPNGEWFQVEYSEIEPRWNFPCLAHSFNVTSRVRYILRVSDILQFFADNLCHVCFCGHRLHRRQHQRRRIPERAAGQRARQGGARCLEDCLRPLPVPLWRGLQWDHVDQAADLADHEEAQCRLLPHRP